MIDTNYKSLEEIDSEIRRFYSEDIRTRIIGYTEPDDNEIASPIKENYTVIVLNRPEKVTYDYVASRIGRRFGRDVINAALQKAIGWEDFEVNHDKYSSWLGDYLKWGEEKPTEEVVKPDGDIEYVSIPAPVKPSIDLANRRAHYEVIEHKEDSGYYNIGSEYKDTHDDELLVTTRVFTYTKRSEQAIADQHQIEALPTRYAGVYSVLPITLESGVKTGIDVGRGKDGVLGIDNIKDTILHLQLVDNPGTVFWIMSDNSVAELTSKDLRNALVAFNTRKQQVFKGYSEWRSGDKQVAFKL